MNLVASIDGKIFELITVMFENYDFFKVGVYLRKIDHFTYVTL